MAMACPQITHTATGFRRLTTSFRHWYPLIPGGVTAPRTQARV